MTTIIHVKIIRLAYLLFLSGLVVGLAMAAPSLATTTPNGIESSATEAVKGTINDLLKVLDDETLKQSDQAEERRHEIEKIIKHRVDYEEMARRALGTPWPTLSHRERHEFVDLFVQLLRDTFAGRITERSDEEVVFLGELREDAFAEVKAQMKGRKIDTPIDFRLIHRAHEWWVYDVVIDGASVVSNYRSQFTSIIRDVSYVGLVKKMKRKAIAVKVFEKSPAP
ncbi:MAG TPA: ABC transporter substrate-binding protein [Nitrospiraceae bacterium]|nr:ABC transporter substrate-binding protein [Nitrospiraceae bacterium]